MALKQFDRRGHNFSGNKSGGVRRSRFKALSGRGRKLSVWALALCFEILDEFCRLRNLGEKFSADVSQKNSLNLIFNAEEGNLFHFFSHR